MKRPTQRTLPLIPPPATTPHSPPDDDNARWLGPLPPPDEARMVPVEGAVIPEWLKIKGVDE